MNVNTDYYIGALKVTTKLAFSHLAIEAIAKMQFMGIGPERFINGTIDYIVYHVSFSFSRHLQTGNIYLFEMSDILGLNIQQTGSFLGNLADSALNFGLK